MAVTVTYQDVTRRAPEIPSETEEQQARIEAFIEDAMCELSENYFTSSCCYKSAIAYAAAHLMTISGADGTAGQGPAAGSVASEQVGDLNVSYASSGAAAATPGTTDWFSTAYGQRVLSLMKSCSSGRFTLANKDIYIP